MTTIVMRILCDNLPALQKSKSRILKHIPHQYSVQMQEKSQVVRNNLFPLNRGNLHSFLEIMDSLQKYVPDLQGETYPILCCGDGLSVERMVHCREARLNGSDPQKRFEGLVEAPQEFHKDMILLQVRRNNNGITQYVHHTR